MHTLLQLLAATNQRCLVGEASISFNGTSNTATPILSEIVKQTSGGTITNADTLVKEDAAYGETIQTVGKDTATVEPTDSGAVLITEYVHPQTGFLWQSKYAEEMVIIGAGRLGLRVTPGATITCNARFVAVE